MAANSGKQRQIQDLNALTSSFLRCVAFSAAYKSSSAQALTVVRSIGSPGTMSVIWVIIGWLMPVLTLTVESTTGRSYSFATRATATILLTSSRRSRDATDVTWMG